MSSNASNAMPGKPRRVPVSAGHEERPAPNYQGSAEGGEEVTRQDVVAVASEESFPASDPPAWTSTKRVGGAAQGKPS
jgi:hypothetical protein